jgi:hypothetical protein
MVRETNIVHLEPDSDLAHLLEGVDGAPLRLEVNGVHYVLRREDEDRPIMSNEEYQRIRDETLGSLSSEEGARMLAAIYRAGEEDAGAADRR